MSREFSPELTKKIAEISARYPKKRAALLPVLHLVQSERGHISPEAEKIVASSLEIKPIHVREAVTFYSMFSRRPLGRFHLQVCSNLSCSLAGGQRIVEYLTAKLGIKIGETTRDGMYSLAEVECLGACERAPCMRVNTDYHGNLDRDKIDRLLASLK